MSPAPFPLTCLLPSSFPPFPAFVGYNIRAPTTFLPHISPVLKRGKYKICYYVSKQNNQSKKGTIYCLLKIWALSILGLPFFHRKPSRPPPSFLLSTTNYATDRVPFLFRHPTTLLFPPFSFLPICPKGKKGRRKRKIVEEDGGRRKKIGRSLSVEHKKSMSFSIRLFLPLFFALLNTERRKDGKARAV